MDLQAIGCINKAGLGKNEQTGLVPPSKDSPQEQAAGRDLSQEATMRTEALGIHRHLREGTGLPRRQAVGERQAPNLQLTLA